MGKTAFLFPGQGAQKQGVGQDFYENSARSREIFREADEILGFSMEDLCFQEDPRLDLTEYTQAALLTVSIAMWAEIRGRGYGCDMAAGLSLGEYGALVVSGGMTFGDAVRVVRRRGQLMQKAVPAGEGGMAAVMGLTAPAIAAVVDPIPEVQIANDNCPGQIVISGRLSAVQEACARLKEAGARRTVPLNVSGPFHSSLLAGAGRELGELLWEVPVNRPRIPYVTNVTGSFVTESDDIRDLLARQVSSTVRFREDVEAMIAAGADRFVEIGPGRSLSGFVRKISRKVSVCSVGSWQDLDQLDALLAD